MQEERTDDKELILDTERLQMLFGDSRELIEEIYQIVISDFPEISRNMGEAVAAEDFAGTSQFAHTLKGSIANIGGVQASRTAHLINTAAKAHDAAECSRLYARFTDDLDQFIQALRTYADGVER